MGKTTFLSNELLDHVLNNAAYSAPADVYVGLYTGVPSDAGGGTEVTGGAYARQAAGTPFGVASSESVTTTTDISFPQATADWGNVVAMGIFDASTDGNLLYWNWMVASWQGCVGQNTGDVFTAPGHGFSDTNTVVFDGDNLPTGVDNQTIYYVISSTTDTFQVSATEGGAAVTLTGDGYGFVGLQVTRNVLNGDTLEFLTGNLTVTEE